MEYFRDEPAGLVMKIEPNENGKFITEIWFDYTLKLMKNIKEGDFLAAPSFKSERDKKHYVILQVVKKFPRHFALKEDNLKKGYPGFLTEAARNISQDWFSHYEESHDDNPKIICEAIPVNMGFWEGEEKVEEDYELPMLGAEAKLLSYEFMQKILNKGLDENEDNITEIGKLQHNNKIRVLIRIEDLLRLHFGIFGFTGAGKSNLISTLISKLLENSPKGTKIVIFDIMGEYLALLSDLLYKYPSSKIIGIGSKTFVESIYKYYQNENRDNLKKAAIDLLKTTLFPKKLFLKRKYFYYPFVEFLKRKIFKVYEEGIFSNVNKLFEEAGINRLNISQKDKPALDEILKIFGNKKISDVKDELLKEIKNLLAQVSTTNAQKVLKYVQKKLENMRETFLPEDALISIPRLVEELNNEEEKGLYIIQSHDPDALKRFVFYLSSNIYERRRQEGIIKPLVSFIFDEADEFIPQDKYKKGDSEISRQAIELLARRGRKFGLGIGIATQRVVYLDTNIMSQPHTYFISKLPRVSDRERVAEAFAISEDIFEQTFKFGKGDWLLVSHDATGLESVPFPIHTENAEERILEFLKLFLKYQS